MGIFHYRYGRTFLATLVFLTPCMVSAQEQGAVANPRVILDTSMGPVTLELYPDKAPASVENFMHYVDTGFLNGLLFHRVIPNFMIQGGGFEPGMKSRTNERAPVQNEADNGLLNARGTVAMGPHREPHSASSQFFINLLDNKQLDHTSKSSGRTWGYAVFGRVVAGMDVVDAIAKVATGSVSLFQDVPTDDVLINTATRVGDVAPAE